MHLVGWIPIKYDKLIKKYWVHAGPPGPGDRGECIQRVSKHKNTLWIADRDELFGRYPVLSCIKLSRLQAGTSEHQQNIIQFFITENFRTLVFLENETNYFSRLVVVVVVFASTHNHTSIPPQTALTSVSWWLDQSLAKLMPQPITSPRKLMVSTTAIEKHRRASTM